MATEELIEVRVTERERRIIEALRHISPEQEARFNQLLEELYEQVWDELFEGSQDLLDSMADEAHRDYVNGRTQDFDPDTYEIEED
jgi:chorismate mutase